MAAYPIVNFGRIHFRNLTCRLQMASVNDLESLALKVCASLLDHVIAKPGRMNQRDPSRRQRAKGCYCCDAWQQYGEYHSNVFQDELLVPVLRSYRERSCLS
jgi:hypothetical protein